jgi:hypothetical protein
MDWLWKFAQDYGDGSRGSDFMSTQDGSESNDNQTFNAPNPFDLSKSDGDGQVPDYENLNHPSTPEGENAAHNSDNNYQGKTEHEPQDSDKFVTQPFSEQMVDDNHANADGGMFSSAMMRLFAVQGQEADFLTSPTQGGPADSPQILDDGHADEELERDQEGVKNTINDFDPTTKNDNTWIYHPDITDKDEDYKNNPSDVQINKGQTSFAHLTFRPSMITHIPVEKKADYHWGDDSNVEQTYNPDEEHNIQVNKKEDFGTKDYGAETNMSDSPNQTDSNDESKNYSGFDNTASLKDLPDKNGELSEYQHPWLNHPDTLKGHVDMLPIPWVKQFQNNEVNPEHVKKLAQSIANEGLYEPIQLGIGRKDRTVTLGDGNHRTFACESLGMTHIPVHGYSYSSRKGGKVYDKMSRVGENFPKYFAPREAFDEFKDLVPPVKSSDKNSLLNIIMKTAVSVMPSSNPNSGHSEEDDEVRNTMTDGKPSYVFDNAADKELNDSNIYHERHTKYKNKDRAGDDNLDYFNTLNSGAGFGNEGDTQNFSGVDN